MTHVVNFEITATPSVDYIGEKLRDELEDFLLAWNGTIEIHINGECIKLGWQSGYAYDYLGETVRDLVEDTQVSSLVVKCV